MAGGGGHIGSRAGGGGDEGGSEQRLGLTGTCGFPWPQPGSSTHPSPLSFGPHLLMRVPPVCKAPSWGC